MDPANVTIGDDIQVWGSMVSGGAIDVTGSLVGSIKIDANVDAGATIDVGGLVSGSILVAEVNGTVDVVGGVTGSIVVADVDGAIIVDGGVGGLSGSIDLVNLSGAITVDDVTNGAHIKVDGDIEDGGSITVSDTATGDGPPSVLWITGNVDSGGSISVDTLAGTLKIDQDLGGAIDVVIEMEDGTLDVDGTVGGSATIDIANMVTGVGSGSTVELGSNGEEFLGTLTLTSGIDDEQSVTFIAPVGSTATIDLTSSPIAGTLELEEGCVDGAEIINGGAVDSLYVILAGASDDFACEATFASIESGGKISTDGGDLGGTLTITGDVAGVIAGGGDISGGSSCESPGIDIGGSMCGEITAVGSITGYVNFAGEYNGDIEDDDLEPCDWFGDVLGVICVETLGLAAKVEGTMLQHGCACAPATCPEPPAPPAGREWATNDCVESYCDYDCTMKYFGDVTGNGGPVNINDIYAVNACFAYECGLCEGGVRAGCDISPCGGNQGVDIDDVLSVLDAYGGTYGCDHPCDCTPCGEETMRFGGNNAADVGDVLITFMTTFVPTNRDRFAGAVDVLVGWLVENLTCAERSDLIDALEDPALEFASRFAESLVPGVVDTLACAD